MNKNLDLEIENLFWKDKEISEFLPRNVFDWAKSIMLENCKKTENKLAIKRLLDKITHTKKVVEAGLEIVEKTKNKKWNKTQALIICFLHDIGRFRQLSLYNTFKDFLSVDHANLGFSVFLEKGFRIDKKYKCNEKEIAEAIEWHNKKEYKGKNIYVKLIRDADKIGLFKEMNYLFAKENVKKEGYVGKNLSKEVFSAFIKNQNIEGKIVKTEADYILHKIRWLWNLNFKESKQICRELKVPQNFKRRIGKMDVNPEDLKIINQKLDHF